MFNRTRLVVFLYAQTDHAELPQKEICWTARARLAFKKQYPRLEDLNMEKGVEFLRRLRALVLELGLGDVVSNGFT